MILHGDCLAMLQTLEAETVQTCVTSPPYWCLRDYGVPGQLGLESSPAEYVEKMVQVFREVRRVLKADGTLWLNLGDSYANLQGGGESSPVTKNIASPRMQDMSRFDGLKRKDLVGIPWRMAFALQADGWYLRSDIIWAKPNPMPESVTDRPTKAHEYIFLMSKSERYYYDHEAIQEACEPGVRHASPRKAELSNEKVIDQRTAAGFARGVAWGDKRNKRTVWTVASSPYPGAHFATFPPKLIEPCILAGSRPGDTVLDPFAGSGTTLYVAKELNRQCIGIELNPAYIQLIDKRLAQGVLPLMMTDPDKEVA
jgi:DNA modification methylase